jgi:hypothetical protein
MKLEYKFRGEESNSLIVQISPHLSQMSPEMLAGMAEQD